MTNKSLPFNTTKQRVLALLFVVLTCGLFSSSVYAHSIKAAITTVLFNPRTENIEVMHRFNVHDAEHAVKALFDKEADIIGNEATQREFADYVSSHFALVDSNNKPIALRQVGYELEGKFFWIYQETSQPPELEGLKVQHNALRELWPEQVNTLNVEGNGPLKTLTFTGNVTLLEVSFKRDHH